MSTSSATEQYYPYPGSVIGFNPTMKAGMHAVLTISTLSTLSTSGLLCFITYHTFFSKGSGIAVNQNLLLLVNLLIGDLLQAAGILINYHWLSIDAILAPSHACTAQGWMVNLGDISSGCFVFMIAIHTATSVLRGKLIPLKQLSIVVACCWVFCIILSSLGLMIHGRDYYAAAGFWCWVNQKHDTARLWSHYIWIFLFEFGTLAIYLVTFGLLRKRMIKLPSAGSKSNMNTAARVNRATYYMIMYPIIYFICTAPLAISRMYAMSGGHKTPLWFYSFAGCLIISCGWIDSLVYTLTRRIFTNASDQHSGGTSRSNNNHFGSLADDRYSKAFALEETGSGHQLSAVDGNIGLHKPEPVSASVLNSITKTTTITKTSTVREKDGSRKPRTNVFGSSPEESDNESLIQTGSPAHTDGSEEKRMKA